MKNIQIIQTLSNMQEGRFYYYTQTKDGENYIAKDVFSVSMDYFTKVYTENKCKCDKEADALIVKEAFKNRYGKEYFQITLNGEDITPEQPTEDQIIREEYASKNMTLPELLDELDKEKNLFNKLTGILRLTAKFRMIVLNELIENRFSEMETEYEELQKKVNNMKGVMPL